MIKALHYLKDPKLWELWYIPQYGSCRVYIINRMLGFPYNSSIMGPQNPIKTITAHVVPTALGLRTLEPQTQKGLGFTGFGFWVYGFRV